VRKWNAILSAVILILFALHGILGAFSLFGTGIVIIQRLARVLFVLVALHGLICILLTVQSVKVWIGTGAPYTEENKSFWVRRISGVVILILMCFHMITFGAATGEMYGAAGFSIGKLVMQLVFIGAILTHIAGNSKPLFVALGNENSEKRTTNFLFVFSILLFIMAAGMIVYYVRCSL
jgi:succinate dehydrogenase/fumarate reductase cytochrome b subunit